jgi:transposase
VVRRVTEIRPNCPTEWAARKEVAATLGIGAAETVRTWARTAAVDTGRRPGVTSEEAAEIKRPKVENAEPRRANEIPKAASAFFPAGLDRPSKRARGVHRRAPAGVPESSRSAESSPATD